jgi:phosphoglucosamine mutase
LAELLDGVTMMHQVLINVPIRPDLAWESHGPLAAARDQALAVLQNRGRILIRPSGTEPVLRVMVEASDAQLATTLAKDMADSVAHA